MKISPFPFADRPRLFGVAVSHFQVEGDDPCDWTDWESAGKTRGGPCGRAAGSWERYEEDAEAAAALGANAFRFSVSWSRVEPRRGEFDEAALERYARLVDRLDALGLEPVVTLLHYTHPRWFHAETPWTSTASVDAFARFAARTARALGPKARCWTVLNEPLVLVLGGFLDGQVPPGIASARDAARALGPPSRRARGGRGRDPRGGPRRRHRRRAQHDGLRSGAGTKPVRPGSSSASPTASTTRRSSTPSARGAGAPTCLRSRASPGGAPAFPPRSTSSA